MAELEIEEEAKCGGLSAAQTMVLSAAPVEMRIPSLLFVDRKS
jgi:hypothetical protein